MCLAIPGKILSITGSIAEVDIVGNTTKADISVMENLKVGDYILVHAGLAIQKLSDEDAKINLDLLRELAEALEP